MSTFAPSAGMTRGTRGALARNRSSSERCSWQRASEPDGAKDRDGHAESGAEPARIHLRATYRRADIAKARVEGIEQQAVMQIGGVDRNHEAANGQDKRELSSYRTHRQTLRHVCNRLAATASRGVGSRLQFLRTLRPSVRRNCKRLPTPPKNKTGMAS